MFKKFLSAIILIILATFAIADTTCAREREPIKYIQAEDDEYIPAEWGRIHTGIPVKDIDAEYTVDPDLFSVTHYDTAYIIWHQGLITQETLIQIDAELWAQGEGTCSFVGNYTFYYKVKDDTGAGYDADFIAYRKDGGELEVVKIYDGYNYLYDHVPEDLQELAYKLIRIFNGNIKAGNIRDFSLNLRNANDRLKIKNNWR